MVSVKQFYADEWKRFKEKHLKIFSIILVLFVIVVVVSFVFLMSRPDQGYQRIVELQKVLREIIPEHITIIKTGRVFIFLFSSIKNGKMKHTTKTTQASEFQGGSMTRSMT